MKFTSDKYCGMLYKTTLVELCQVTKRPRCLKLISAHVLFINLKYRGIVLRDVPVSAKFKDGREWWSWAWYKDKVAVIDLNTITGLSYLISS